MEIDFEYPPYEMVVALLKPIYMPLLVRKSKKYCRYSQWMPEAAKILSSIFKLKRHLTKAKAWLLVPQWSEPAPWTQPKMPPGPTTSVPIRLLKKDISRDCFRAQSKIAQNLFSYIGVIQSLQLMWISRRSIEEAGSKHARDSQWCHPSVDLCRN